jgi:hypothetical protein
MEKNNKKISSIFLAFIIFIIVILFSAWFNDYFSIKDTYKNIEQKNISTVPKIIWMIWDSENYPLLLTKNIELLKKHNPDHDVIVVHLNNVEKYIDKNTIHKSYDKQIIQHKSDIIRILLLLKYGGTYVDATFLINKPLNELFPYENVEFAGFHSHFMNNYKHNSPVIENWFMRASPNSKFIKLWKNEFYKALNNKPLYIFKNYKYKQNITSTMYLTQHLCAQVVLQKNKHFEKRFKLYNSEYTAFKIHKKFKWDIEKSMDYLQSSKSSEEQFIFLKITGYGRRFLKDDKLIDKTSYIGKILNM